MRKLKLEVSELRVDTFEATVSRLDNPGTVRANEDTVKETVCDNTHSSTSRASTRARSSRAC
jgi:hypothetical protein